MIWIRPPHDYRNELHGDFKHVGARRCLVQNTLLGQQSYLLLHFSELLNSGLVKMNITSENFVVNRRRISDLRLDGTNDAMIRCKLHSSFSPTHFSGNLTLG